MRKNRTGLTGYLGASYRLSVYEVLLSDVVRESVPPAVHEAIISLYVAEESGDKNHPRLAAAIKSLTEFKNTWAKGQKLLDGTAEMNMRKQKKARERRKKGQRNC